VLYVELIGFLSLAIEATLGVPQLVKNYKNKSTEGLSIALILSWFVGDAFKTVYFISTRSPLQFIMCGALQLLVDCAILFQINKYKRKL